MLLNRVMWVFGVLVTFQLGLAVGMFLRPSMSQHDLMKACIASFESSTPRLEWQQ
jgi:hypothetical protein